MKQEGRDEEEDQQRTDRTIARVLFSVVRVLRQRLANTGDSGRLSLGKATVEIIEQ